MIIEKKKQQKSISPLQKTHLDISSLTDEQKLKYYNDGL